MSHPEPYNEVDELRRQVQEQREKVDELSERVEAIAADLAKPAPTTPPKKPQ